MLRLLYDCPWHGYPAEYLVSRIHGRLRTGLPSAQGFEKEGLATDAPIWSAAALECRWIYTQMEKELRKILSPMFVFYELNTLVSGLRRLAAEQPQSNDDNLAHSLLAEELKRIVLGKDTAVQAVAKTEKFMAGSRLHVEGLSAAYQQEGVRGCEGLIRSRFFELVPGSCSHPAVTDFFRTMIDLKNILLLAKHVRWNMSSPLILIKGGYAGIRGSARAKAEDYLRLLIQRMGFDQRTTVRVLNPIALENLMEEWLAGKMKRLLRTQDPVQCSMGYVWHCLSAARKKSNEYHGGRFAEHFPEGEESLP